MRILVDGYNMVNPSGTGIATYGRSFVQAATAIGCEVSILCGEEWSGRPAPGGVARAATKLKDFMLAPLGLRPERVPPNAMPEAVSALLPAQTIWNRSRLFRAAKGAYRRTGLFCAIDLPGIDVAHWTYPLPLFVRGATNIYTIHDIVPIKFPWMVRNQESYRRLCEDVCRRADHVVTVSEQSRRDILDEFDIASERVTNCYQTIMVDKPAPAQAAASLARLGLPSGSYFLFFGAIEPKKNLLRLLEAYEGLCSRTRLVVVGKPGWHCDREVAKLRQLTATGSGVIWLDFLERSDLMALAKHAKAVLFPSLYEGFGLPAAEAMALGTPVLAGAAGSLPEIVGDGAVLVDPYSVPDIREGMQMLDRDDAARAALGQRGLAQAQAFSPERYAGHIAALLRKLK